jgi:hypothetical protein
MGRESVHPGPSTRIGFAVVAGDAAQRGAAPQDEGLARGLSSGTCHPARIPAIAARIKNENGLVIEIDGIIFT